MHAGIRIRIFLWSKFVDTWLISNLLFHRISSLSAEDIKRDSKKVAANAVVN